MLLLDELMIACSLLVVVGGIHNLKNVKINWFKDLIS